ncbi:unnamed protein product [Paramecium sonneborni]|uniref:guanylate cyclase n=1 Tax=Paramecium sonneborni TaxID=65129 RepID=A0A8S1QN87_9CILI|nr:unnamed protein product [Paramecium sonneborni]
MKSLSLIIFEYLKSKYQNVTTKQIKYKYHLEMEQGECMNMLNQSDNKVRSTLINFTIMSLFFKQFERIGVVIYFIVMILDYSFFGATEEDLVVYVMPLTMHFVLQISKALYFDFIKRKQDDIVNNRRITRFRKLRKDKPKYQVTQQQQQQSSFKKPKISLYENCFWGCIEQGDIIYLKRNEVCPADMLLLDVSDEILQVQTQNFQGLTLDQTRQPTQLTMLKNGRNRIQGFDYKKLLTGTIQYNINESSINGFIKLKKDPKGEYFDNKNIIFREEQIRTCQYVIGVVLQTGNNCFCYLNMKKSEKKSFFVQKSSMFFALTLGISLIVSMFSWFLASFAACLPYNQADFDSTTLIFYILQYLKTTPIYFYNCIDLIEVINAHIKYKKYIGVKSTKIDYLQLNPVSVGDMVMTEFVCFDKTGTITNGESRIHAIIVEDTMYKFNYNNMIKNQWNTFKDHLQNQIKNDPNFQIEEIDESDIEIQSKKVRHTGIFKLTLQHWNSKKMSSCEFIKSELASSRSIANPLDDVDIEIENMKLEDFDDSHYRVTPELSKAKPKPFFNKKAIATAPVQMVAQSQGGISHSQEEEFLIKQQSQKEEQRSFDNNNKSIKSKKFLEHSSSDMKRQYSAKRSFQMDKVAEEDIEIVFHGENEFYKHLIHGQNKLVYQESLLQLLLCLEIVSRYSPSEDQFMHDSSQYSFDQEVLRFVGQLDIKFLCCNEFNGKVIYIVDFFGEVMEFQVMATYNNGNNQLGVLILYPDKLQERFMLINENDPMESLQYVFIMREETNQLPVNIDVDKPNREYWDKVFQKLHMGGMRSVIYSKVYLKEQDASIFLSRFQGELGMSAFQQISKDMQIVQVVGIKEQIRKDTKILINQMKAAELSLYLLSGDELSRVLPIAFKSKILNQYDTLLYLDNDNARVVMKNHLTILSQSLKLEESWGSKPMRMSTLDKHHRTLTIEEKQATYPEVKSFSIILSGEYFNLILQDSYLLSHFQFLLYFCNSLIAYKMDQKQKATIVQIIQTQFIGNKRVLAVGDSYNDNYMFCQSNIGVQYCHYPIQLQQYQRGGTKLKLNRKVTSNKSLDNPLNRKFLQNEMWVVPTTDICLKNYLDLSGLMFFESRIFAEVYDDLLVFSFYRSLLIIYILFFSYASYCSQNQTIFTGVWLTVYQSILLFIQQIVSLKSKFDKQYDKDSITYIEQFKCNVKIFKKKKVLSFIFKINGNAMLDAALFYQSLQIIDEIQFDTFKQMLLILLILSDIVKLVVSTNYTKHTWIVFIFTYLICWLMTSILSAYFQNMDSFTELFTVPSTWLAFIFYGFSQFCLSSIIEYIQPLFCQSLIDQAQYDQVQNYIYKSQKNGAKRYHNLIKRFAQLAGKVFKKNKDEMDISIQDIICELKVNQDRINKFTLRFLNKDTEMKFKRLSKLNWFKFERIKLGLSLIFLEVFALLIYSLTHGEEIQSQTYFIIYILSISIQVIVQIMTCSGMYLKHFFQINLIIASIRLLTKMISDLEQEGTYIILLSQCYILIIIFSRLHIPLLNFTIATLSIVGFLKNYSMGIDYYQKINGVLIVLITLIFFISLQYKLHMMERQDFLLAATLNQETTSMTNVLSILLPKFIRDRINAKGVFEIQENQGEVSILFCDICGFDDLIAVEKENIVNLLDSLFRGFDGLCVSNGMQKIETVGKTFMAAGGLKAVDQGTKYINQSAVKRAVQLSLEMMEYSKKFKFGQSGNVKIKIGVHYGRVIAGVIGHHKPQFSLIGDTVNTTSRVCSTGQDGEITLSNEAYMELNMPDLQFNQIKVNAKGKGELITWQVVTSIKRNTDKKVRKKKGLVPKFDSSQSDLPTLTKLDPVTPKTDFRQLKVPQQIKQLDIYPNESNGKMEKDFNSENNTTSFSLLKDSLQSKDIRPIRKRGQRGPTLIMKAQDAQKVVGPLQLQHSTSQNNIQHSSNKNLPPIVVYQAEESAHSNNLKDESFFEKNQTNLLHDLSQKLRRDLYIEILDEAPDYEVEIEKIQFDEDEQFKSEDLQLERSRFYLDFKENQKELAQEFMDQKEGINIVFMLFLHFLQFLSKTLTLLFVQHQENWISVFVIRFVASILLLTLAMLQNKKLKHRFYKYQYFLITYFGILISILLEFILMPEKSVELQAAEGILLICFFCSLSIIKIKYKVYFNLCLFIVQLLIVLILYKDLAIAYYTIFQSCMTFIVQYHLFFQDLGTFNNKRSLELKKLQTQNLVKYLLPTHILKQFLSNSNQRMVLVDQFEDATLLFADIAGFTEYSSKVEPEQVVNMLRNLFTEFDKICLNQNAYKLYTIGDCYVAFGIVDVTQRNPPQEAKNVVELGFKMIEIIRQVRSIIGFDGLDMRIGIHTGKVIGGILGTEIVRYDVYGADVMISNKMESNGERGKVQVSEETKQLLEQSYPDQFLFSFNKEVEFKSIFRKTKGYFIDPIKNDSDQDFDDMNHYQFVKDLEQYENGVQ